MKKLLPAIILVNLLFGCSYFASLLVNGAVKNYVEGTEYVFKIKSESRDYTDPINIKNKKGEFSFEVRGFDHFPAEDILILKFENGKQKEIQTLKISLDSNGYLLTDKYGTIFRISKSKRFAWNLNNLIIEE
jgi:hypothetical protein